jgi:hypothetical protein
MPLKLERWHLLPLWTQRLSNQVRLLWPNGRRESAGGFLRLVLTLLGSSWTWCHSRNIQLS